MACWTLVFLLLSLAAAQNVCQLRLIARDKGNDGWNGNYLTVSTDGVLTIDDTPCGFSEVVKKGTNQATYSLSLTGSDSTKISVPYGASLQVNYTGIADNECDENTWEVQLWDVRAPYGEISLITGGPYVNSLTSSNTLSKVTCGPAPVCAIGTVNVGIPANANELAPYITAISWAGAFIDANQLRYTQYQVSWCNPATGVDCTSPDNYKHVGRTSSNQLRAIFPPGGTYQLSIEAFNQWGLSPAVFVPFSTSPNLAVAEIVVITSDSFGDGWPDDASVMITLDGIRFASVQFPCNDTDTANLKCKVRTHRFYAPANIDLIFEANFIAPGSSANECSFEISWGGNNRVASGQDQQGPTIHTFVFPIHLAATSYTPPAPPASLYTANDCAPEQNPSSICSSIDLNSVSDGGPCTVPGVSCRAPVKCYGACNATQIWTCLASGTWASEVGCTCATAPACASFQALTTQDCSAGLSCVTDDTSLACNGPTAWGDCIPDIDECGSGKQYRNNYVKGEGVCIRQTESQTCEVGCPVDCVGSWGEWSPCSSTCGSGYQSNTYTISTFPKDGGDNCDYYQGEIDFRQCVGLPDCGYSGNNNAPFNCYYDLEQYDAGGDAWPNAKLNVIVGSNDPISIPFIAPTSDLIYNKQVTQIVAANGTTVQLQFVANGGDINEASYSVIQVIPLADRRVPIGTRILSPANLDLTLAPESTNFVAKCVNCAGLDCESKNRVLCEVAQDTDNTCGPCLPGYGLPKSQGDSKKGGTSTCVAINACLAYGDDFCSQTNQRCTNADGGYKCDCDGTVVEGSCVPRADVVLLQERSEFLKKDIRWAKDRLEHRAFLRDNPPASFAEMESRISESIRLGFIPTSATAGFYISRCDPTLTCAGGSEPVNVWRNSSGCAVYVGDDHNDNLFYSYPAGYDYSATTTGTKSSTPQTFKTDGSILTYRTYPSYGQKQCLPEATNSKPFGTNSATLASSFTSSFTKDPNSCCFAISHVRTSTGIQYNWDINAGSNTQIKLTPGSLSSGNFYQWTFWTTYATGCIPPTYAPATYAPTIPPTTAAPTTTTTAAPVVVQTDSPAVNQTDSPAVNQTDPPVVVQTTAPTIPVQPATNPPFYTTPAPIPTSPPLIPQTNCGQWNQTCCSLVATDVYAAALTPCGQKDGADMICEPITHTCHLPCPPKRTRKDWLEMSLPERDTFVRAVRILGLVDPGNPDGTSYFGWTARLHRKSSGCCGDPLNVHNNVWFLPWHRFFLKDYEDKINSLGGEFACIGIPTLDYSKPSITADGVLNLVNDVFTNEKPGGLWRGIGKIDGCTRYSVGHPFPIASYGTKVWYGYNTRTPPSLQFFGADVPDGTAFPGVYQWNAYTGSAGAWVWAGTYADSAITRSTTMFTTSKISTGAGASLYNPGTWTAYGPYMMYTQVLSSSSYVQFNNQVNAYGHQAIHSWIGGHMSQLESAALDPVFFMVHAFVDRLWAAWQECNGLVPLTSSLISASNPKVWDWTATQSFNGNMPWFASGRTPLMAHDISAMGYQYTPGFIQNVISMASATFCGGVSTARYTNPALVAAQERVTIRNKIWHDPKNPPRVVATSFLEAFIPVTNLPQAAPSKKAGKAVGLAAAKRKKLLSVARGTAAKPGCYNPKKDEVTNLKSFASVYKKVKRGGKVKDAIQAVKDAECFAMDYSSSQVADPKFVESMGENAIKRRAQGALTHECYERQKGKRAEQLKGDYQKQQEKQGKVRAPKKVIIPKPSARFGTMEDFGPPPQNPPNATGGATYGKAKFMEKHSHYLEPL